MICIILTEEVINKIIKNDIKCTYLNEHYVILYKKMEAKDKDLESYFNNIKLAQESGINIPKIIEYRLLNSSKEERSKGIFVEERARGTVLNIRGLVLEENSDYDFKKIINEYLERMDFYLNELEKRANASQQIYNKFLNDFTSLYKFGLRPDPNSLNYLFDEDIGFTIIDPYYDENNIINKNNLFKYLINDIYGVSRPTIIIKKETVKVFYYLPEYYKKRLKKYSNIINKKLFLAFKTFGYSEEYILKELANNKMRFFTEEISFESEELQNKLKEEFKSKKTSLK